MTTTLLPKEQVDVLRSVGDAANVLLALVLIDRLYPGRSTRIDELAVILGKDRRVIEKRLGSLCASDRVCFDGRGYVLLEGGRALLLASAPTLAAQNTPQLSTLESDDFDQALALSPATEEAQAPQAQALPEIITIEATESPSDVGQTAHTMRALLEEDINTLNPSEDITSSINSSAQNVQSAKPSQPTTLQILDATHLLFDKTMTTAGLQDKPRRVVIGWVAQAWDQRKYLRSPQGLIYSRLSSNQQPQQKYYDHPRDYLPEHYLVALGLAVAKPQPQVEPEADPEPEEVQDEPVTDEAAMTAWNKVLDSLRSEIHSGPFDKWFKDTVGIRLSETCLVVGCRNEATREWLEDSGRRKTAERKLVGVLARAVDVEFVVAESKAADD